MSNHIRSTIRSMLLVSIDVLLSSPVYFCFLEEYNISVLKSNMLHFLKALFPCLCDFFHGNCWKFHSLLWPFREWLIIKRPYLFHLFTDLQSLTAIFQFLCRSFNVVFLLISFWRLPRNNLHFHWPHFKLIQWKEIPGPSFVEIPAALNTSTLLKHVIWFHSNTLTDKAAGEEDPQRIIIKNKLVNTGKLLNDLMFWVEVDR